MNEVVELQGMLKQLLAAINESLTSGELSDEVQGAIADTLQNLWQRIEQLQGNVEGLQPQGSSQQIQPGMPSSNVEGFAYDPKSNRLLVRFLGDYPNRNGPVYAYDGVPPVIFDLFRRGSAAARTNGSNKWGTWWKGKSPSLGASVYTLLKLGGFPYQRLT